MRASPRNTKEAILYAATELIAEKGYRETSMKEIAQKIGIQAASIYNHYASKELILEDLLDFYLERMERFYQRFEDTTATMPENPSLEAMLQYLMLTYEPNELPLMYNLTRIVHHEQFHSSKAAEALIGSGYRRYMEAHVRFFDRLSDAGLLQGKERNHYYGELFARMSLTFATQFLHPEIKPTIDNQSELYRFVIALVIHYEQSFAQNGTSPPHLPQDLEKMFPLPPAFSGGD